MNWMHRRRHSISSRVGDNKFRLDHPIPNQRNLAQTRWTVRIRIRNRPNCRMNGADVSWLAARHIGATRVMPFVAFAKVISSTRPSRPTRARSPRRRAGCRRSSGWASAFCSEVSRSTSSRACPSSLGASEESSSETARRGCGLRSQAPTAERARALARRALRESDDITAARTGRRRIAASGPVESRLRTGGPRHNHSDC